MLGVLSWVLLWRGEIAYGGRRDKLQTGEKVGRARRARGRGGGGGKLAGSMITGDDELW